MNHLWSPWRMEYIENNTKEEGCIFCIAQANEDGAENLIAQRGERAFVILSRRDGVSTDCRAMTAMASINGQKG